MPRRQYSLDSRGLYGGEGRSRGLQPCPRNVGSPIFAACCCGLVSGSLCVRLLRIQLCCTTPSLTHASCTSTPCSSGLQTFSRWQDSCSDTPVRQTLHSESVSRLCVCDTFWSLFGPLPNATTIKPVQAFLSLQMQRNSVPCRSEDIGMDSSPEAGRGWAIGGRPRCQATKGQQSMQVISRTGRCRS